MCLLNNTQGICEIISRYTCYNKCMQSDADSLHENNSCGDMEDTNIHELQTGMKPTTSFSGLTLYY